MPAPKRPNTAKATETAAALARRRGQETKAAALREAGWLVVPPEQVEDTQAALAYAQRHMEKGWRP
jgi:3-methyladenine DNA glycosylase Tag